MERAIPRFTRQSGIAALNSSLFPSENLTLAERKIFDCWQQIVDLVGGLPAQVREVKISETMRPDFGSGRECLGLWETEKRELSSRGRN